MGLLNSYHKDFIKHLEKMSYRYSMMDVFGDVCGMMAAALEKPFSHFQGECEERYRTISAKYTADEMAHAAEMLGIVVEALELKRESFLGPVLEEIGAANVHNGQFLTPVSVATVMSRITAGDKAANHKDGELVTLNDPACGAGVLLIAGAEAIREAGVPQKDIFVIGGDIDQRACDITFVELSLLGYAARIEHMDALAQKEYSRPRWTVGYFLYGTQWREGKREKVEVKVKSEEVESHGEVVQGTFIL